MMKNILFISPYKKTEKNSSHFVSQLAEKYSAKLNCLFLTQDYEQLARFAFGAGSTANIYQDIKDNFENESLEKLRKAEDNFKKYVKYKNVDFIHEAGNINDIAAHYGKYNDIICLSSNIEQVEEEYNGLVETCLFESGTPVILIPEEQKELKLNKILIAWDGSIRASKAVKSSVDILKNAKEVLVVGVNESEKDVASATHILSYLKEHGINASHLGVKKAHFSVGQTIMEEAENQKADMIIMGAYTHNKIRQAILGGATKYMLSHPKLPILMQH